MPKPLFSITPALTSAPAPVTLTMPAHGYIARAEVTDPCGAAIRGATVTTRGLTATPHGLPAGATSYVDWVISAAHPAAAGGRVSLVLASRQNIGAATGCATGRSPYHSAVAHHALHAVTAAKPDVVSVLLGLGIIVVMLAAVAALGWLAVRGIPPPARRPAGSEDTAPGRPAGGRTRP